MTPADDVCKLRERLTEALARKFHAEYERLAPSFSYVTRKDSRVPFDDLPANNKTLMLAVCREIVSELDALAALERGQVLRLTDEQIVAIRDEHLPSQGEPFDCIGFARAILDAATAERAREMITRGEANDDDGTRGFREGQENMRERAANSVDGWIAKAIRALPIVERDADK